MKTILRRITRTAAVAALLVLLGAGSALAYSYSTATTAGGLTIAWASGSDAASLESDFLSSASGYLTEDFESFGVNTQPGFTIAMGSLTGGGYVAGSAGYQIPYNEYATSGSQYFSNGNVRGPSGKYDFTVNLDSGWHSIGFYMTDLVDIGGIFDLTVTTAGGTEVVHVLDLIGRQASGSLFYFTVLSSSLLESLTYTTSNNDGFGIDDISVAHAPIPGAAWLLGTGLLGLVALRNRLRPALA